MSISNKVFPNASAPSRLPAIDNIRVLATLAVIVMTALASPRLLRNETLAKAGRMTLGIYVIHCIFVDWFEPLNVVISNPAWEIGHILLVYGLALATALLMARHRTLRKFVM